MLPAVVLLAALPAAVVHGLTFEQPSSWNDSDFNTLTWTTAPGDPTAFSVDLVNAKSLSTPLTILTNVVTADGKIRFNLPGVPEGGNYTIVAHPVGNESQVIFTSGPFKIQDSRNPNSSSSTTGSASAGTPTNPAAGTNPTNSGGFGGGVPTAPTDAPTFPNSGGDGDGTGAAPALRPTTFAAAGIVAAAFALVF